MLRVLAGSRGRLVLFGFGQALGAGGHSSERSSRRLSRRIHQRTIALGDPHEYTLSGTTVRKASQEEAMEFKAGDRVKVESESTDRPPRTGVISEVLHGAPSPRYRISWDDGHESIYTPAAGALRPAEPAKRA
jgi:Domain of unknown function (DUF1918)